MENLTLGQFLIVVLAIAGVITAIGGATSVLKRWWVNSKGVKNEEEINHLNERVENVEQQQERLERHQKENEEFTKVMCNSMLALLSHAITGRNDENLRKAEDEIKKYLINK